jgi:hypothetical protein
MPLNGVTNTLTPTNASDATFRAWGSGIAAKLAAAGLVQTADTGQINWTTVLTPAAVSTAQGYEIWRLDDALHATAPIYIKIEYGSGITSAANPGLWFTFGTGSNGAGTLTGPISTRRTLTSTAYATNALDCYWSGSTSHFCAALFVGGTGASTSNCQFFAFERTKDSNGDDTNQGLLVVWKTVAGTGTTAFQQVFWDRTLGTQSDETSLGTLMQSGATAKNGTQVGVFPIFHSNGPFLNPGINTLAYHNADIVAKGAVTFTIYGVSHTFMPIGTTSYAGASINGRSSAPSLMTRYD